MTCEDCIHCKVCKHYKHFEDCEDYQKNCFYKNDTERLALKALLYAAMQSRSYKYNGFFIERTELGGVKEIPFRKATEIVSEKLCQFVSEEKKKNDL